MTAESENKKSRRKNRILGMGRASADRRLYRKLIFNYITKLGINNCYRCNRKLQDYNFTIDHKVSWVKSKTPLETYLDEDNIAFSHFVCNSRDGANSPKQRRKGSALSTPYPEFTQG